MRTTVPWCALSASGEQLWTEAAPGPPVMGDSFGGLVAALPDSTEDSRGLARFAGPASAHPWRYESPGYVVGPAQAPDGTIYAVEWLPGIDSGGAFIWDKFAIALDGTTGRVTARHPLLRDLFTHQPSEPGCASSRLEYAPDVVSPIVGTDGRGYFQVRRLTRAAEGACLESVTADVDHSLTLLALAPTGAMTTEILYRFQRSGAFDVCERTPVPGQVVPASFGGVLATWASFDGVFCTNTYEGKVSRIDRQGTRTDFALPLNTQIAMTADDGLAYLSDQAQTTVTAVQTSNWQTAWTSTIPGKAVEPLYGGGAVIQGLDSTLHTLSSTGTSSSSMASSLINPVRRPNGVWEGLITGTGLAAVTAPELQRSFFSFAGQWGNAQRQSVPEWLGDYYSNYHAIVLSTLLGIDDIFDGSSEHSWV